MNCRALIGALNSAHPPVLTRHVRRTWITGHTEISLRPLMRTMNEGVDDTFIAYLLSSLERESHVREVEGGYHRRPPYEPWPVVSVNVGRPFPRLDDEDP